MRGVLLAGVAAPVPGGHGDVTDGKDPSALLVDRDAAMLSGHVWAGS
jgi:hypothetical protein